MKLPFDMYIKKGSDEECWNWTGAFLKQGYGCYGVGTDNKVVKAHRYMMELQGFDIQDKYVLHKCDNRKCVNPKHLYLGNAQDNVNDCVSRGRARGRHSDMTHCKKGHPYSGSNLGLDKGQRCLACKRANRRKRNLIKGK